LVHSQAAEEEFQIPQQCQSSIVGVNFSSNTMIFNKVTIIDNCGLTSLEIEKISMLSREPISIFYDSPETETQIIERIGNSDCVLVSWQTRISGDILKKPPL
jgi:hypothetical protein